MEINKVYSFYQNTSSEGTAEPQSNRLTQLAKDILMGSSSTEKAKTNLDTRVSPSFEYNLKTYGPMQAQIRKLPKKFKIEHLEKALKELPGYYEGNLKNDVIRVMPIGTYYIYPEKNNIREHLYRVHVQLTKDISTDSPFWVTATHGFVPHRSVWHVSGEEDALFHSAPILPDLQNFLLNQYPNQNLQPFIP